LLCTGDPTFFGLINVQSLFFKKNFFLHFSHFYDDDADIGFEDDAPNESHETAVNILL
jgi:hypothetical protein